MTDTAIPDTATRVEAPAAPRTLLARLFGGLGRSLSWGVAGLTVLLALAFFGGPVPFGPAEDAVAVVAMLVPWMAGVLIVFAAVAVAAAVLAWRSRRRALLTASTLAGVLAVSMVVVPFAGAAALADEYDASLSFAGQLAGLEAPAPDATATYAVVEGEELKVDVHLPEQVEGTLPALVYVHGGGWREGARDESAAAQEWLAEQGFAVFSVDYRLADVPRWQDAVGDVKCALGWVRSHAEDYGVDATKVSVAGDSAGGQLSMLAAYTVGDERFTPSCRTEEAPVASVMTWFAPMDLVRLAEDTEMPAYAEQALTSFIGGSPDAERAAYEASSPINAVAEGLPPTMIVQGAADRLIPVEQGAVMARALEGAGVPVALLDVPWAHHGFTGQWNGWAAQAMRPAVGDFLDQHAR